MKKVISSICVIIFMLIVCVSGNVHAKTQEESASEYLQHAIDSIFTILRNPKWTTKEGQEELYPELRTRVQGMFDFRAISSQIVGTKWDSFTAKEQEDFIEAFRSILEYTYSSSFTNYSGQSVRIERSRINKTGTQAEVTTKILASDGKETTIVYRLIDGEHGWKIYNVLVENINLISSYKTQLQELLVNSTPREIIKKLQAQAITLSPQK